MPVAFVNDDTCGKYTNFGFALHAPCLPHLFETDTLNGVPDFFGLFMRLAISTIPKNSMVFVHNLKPLAAVLLLLALLLTLDKELVAPKLEDLVPFDFLFFLSCLTFY